MSTIILVFQCFMVPNIRTHFLYLFKSTTMAVVQDSEVMFTNHKETKLILDGSLDVDRAETHIKLTGKTGSLKTVTWVRCNFNVVERKLHWAYQKTWSLCITYTSSLRSFCRYLITMVAITLRCKAHKTVDRSNIRIGGSSTFRGMDVCPRFYMLCCLVSVRTLQW